MASESPLYRMKKREFQEDKEKRRIKVTRVRLSSDFRSLPQSDSKVTPKVAFWHVKWLQSGLRVKKSVSRGTPWKSLFSHFWVTLNFPDRQTGDYAKTIHISHLLLSTLWEYHSCKTLFCRDHSEHHAGTHDCVIYSGPTSPWRPETCPDYFPY